MEETLRYGIFLVILVLLFMYDFRKGILPNSILWPAIGVVCIWNYVGLHLPWLSMVYGSGIVGGLFGIQYFVSHGKWIGGGDVWMGVLMGSMLGLWNAVIATFIAYILGAIVGGVFVLLRKKNWSSPIPFGTFLSLGAIVSLLWGEHLVSWYAFWLR